MDLGALMTGGPSGDQGIIKDGSTQSFAKDVIEASRSAIVLVDFWAPWCVPVSSSRPCSKRS